MSKGKFTKKIKQDWLAALRSGDYEQGAGALCLSPPDASAKYCCLGVLFEVVNGEDAWGPRPLIDRLAANHNTGTYGAELIGGVVNDLISMNDGGCDFDEIADYIEKEIPHE